MATVENKYLSSTATSDFEPFVFEGKQLGEVHWLRTSGSGEGMLLAGLWRSDPTRFDYVFPGDETFEVLEGEVTIDIAGGESVTLQKGEIASFAKGTESVWNLGTPFKKFFVISG
jgi:uncharacterized cupin superfamily protein